MVLQHEKQIELDSKKAEYEIKVFPRKKMYIAGYNTTIDCNEAFFTEMIDNFNNTKLFKPYLDVNHKLEENQADIIDLYQKPDGLYAKIVLTPAGYEAIKDRKYRYISPEFGERTDTDGKKYNNVLWAITLTNIPAMEGNVPTLQEQIKLQGASMSNKKLTTKLEAYKLMTELDPAVKEFLTELGSVLDENETIMAEMKAKIGVLTGEVDEASAENEEMKSELAKIEKDTLELEAKSVIENAIKLGQFHPSLQDLKIEQYVKDAESVNKELSLIPKSKSDGQAVSGISSSTKLSSEDRDIMLSAELDPSKPEDVAFYNKINGGKK